MELKDLVTAAVALAGIVATLLTAALGRRQQQRAHEAQIAAQAQVHGAQLAAQRDQLAAQERQLRETSDREHYRRLWERRQAGYLTLTLWVLEVRRSIESFRNGSTWTPPAALPLETLAELAIYADFEVYAQSELLRGYAESIVKNWDILAEAVALEDAKDFLKSLDEKARQMSLLVRTFALRPPAWREPIQEGEPVALSD